MIAATYTQNGAFQVEDVPVPTIAEDELLLEVHASSICGTDLRIIRNGHRKLQPNQKIILGHEFAGVVVEVGRRVAGFHVGQRVGVAPNMGCGQCGLCVRGLPNMCPDYTAFGITLDGAHTEYVRIPNAAITQGSVCVLPDQLPFVQAALLEPLSCVVNGNRACRIVLGDIVVIFGAGPIGLMHLVLAQLSGAAQCLVVDPDETRLAKAVALGATDTIHGTPDTVRERVLEASHGRGADVAITACSVAAVQEQSLALLAPFGRVCFFGGLPKDGSLIRVDSNLVHYRQLTVTGTTGGAPRDFRTALELLAAGRVPIERVISHRFPIGRLAEAFDVALHASAMKVVICRNDRAPNDE